MQPGTDQKGRKNSFSTGSAGALRVRLQVSGDNWFDPLAELETAGCLPPGTLGNAFALSPQQVGNRQYSKRTTLPTSQPGSRKTSLLTAAQMIDAALRFRNNAGVNLRRISILLYGLKHFCFRRWLHYDFHILSFSD
jgi:hypothetical protein